MTAELQEDCYDQYGRFDEDLPNDLREKVMLIEAEYVNCCLHHHTAAAVS